MNYDEVCRARDFVAARTAYRPRVAVILGSGLGDVVGAMTDKDVIPYAEIPGFAHSNVPGHAAQLVFGRLGGREVAVMQGRFHYYEGHSVQTIVFPIFVLRLLGVEDLIVTNACGGINERFTPGDLMLITDHINLLGVNPLIGDNDERFGPRFPDMTEVYTKALLERAEQTAEQLAIPVQKGVYVFFNGPCFETAAEIRAFKALGADAVGMSTVPEATAARYLGMRVLGVGCVTNMATGIRKTEHSHLEVLEVAAKSGRRLTELLLELLAHWT